MRTVALTVMFLFTLSALAPQSKQHVAIRDPSKAMDLYQQAASDYLTYLNSGLDHLRKKEYDLAISDYSKAIALSDLLQVGAAYSGRGSVYLIKQEYELAIADLNKAIALDPNYLDYRFRGLAYFGEGEYKLAIADFQAALNLKPNDPDVSKALEEAKNELKDSFNKENLFGRVINFPFINEQDMQRAASLCQKWQRESSSRIVRDSDDLATYQDFLSEIEAFTTPNPVVAERLNIINFATAQTMALRRLREEVLLPAPSGGAIVRIYSRKSAMPQQISKLFRGEGIKGITRGCRFIAISAEHQSQEEIDDTTAHELVHAYILSSLGQKGLETLPKWFQEGVALYLTDAKRQYENYPVPGLREVSTTPEEYKEYRLVFDYLEAVLGRQEVSKFIRKAVEQQSVEDPLRAAIGTASYKELRNRALDWRSGTGRKNLKLFLLTLLTLSAFIIAWKYWVRYRRRRGQKRHATERLALDLVRQGLQLGKMGYLLEAKKRFDEASRLGSWSKDVDAALEEAYDELGHILL